LAISAARKYLSPNRLFESFNERISRFCRHEVHVICKIIAARGRFKAAALIRVVYAVAVFAAAFLYFNEED
jgi:hypothetical protein